MDLDEKIKGHLDRTADMLEILAKDNTELKERFKETDIKFKETEEQMKRTDKRLESVGIQLGNISANNGDVAEYYFYNALSENPILGGIRFDDVDKNVKARSKRMQDEFDIVMYNGNAIAIIECKYKAHKSDVENLIDKKASHFKQLFRDYENYQVYLGIASFSFYQEIEDFAKENGVAVLKQKGDLMIVEDTNLKAY